MLPRRMVIVGLLCCCIRTGVTRTRSKDLFPAAKRIKRGLTSATAKPIFHSTFSDVHLLFEILMAGIHFETRWGILRQDAELASLRKTRNLDLICEEIIPKKITDIFRLISNISNLPGHLHQDDFERTLLTLVFTIQQIVSSTDEHQRDAWAKSFVQLYKAIKKDLIETN
ncbi:protein FAM180A [Gouania willdenowi]|uniref:Protein FAM180A-like n=1 Tax=Gouania willdenowi TaxID=441366 RepID=A0A8C5G3Z1_GOUWI|nr:protein FAM180A-like [Gouania willdenowi]